MPNEEERDLSLDFLGQDAAAEAAKAKTEVKVEAKVKKSKKDDKTSNKAFIGWGLTAFAVVVLLVVGLGMLVKGNKPAPATSPKTQAAAAEPTKADTPKVESPKAEAPKVQPKVEAPKVQPKVETPKVLPVKVIPPATAGRFTPPKGITAKGEEDTTEEWNKLISNDNIVTFPNGKGTLKLSTYVRFMKSYDKPGNKVTLLFFTTELDQEIVFTDIGVEIRAGYQGRNKPYRVDMTRGSKTLKYPGRGIVVLEFDKP